jgi:hypothetical protein
MEFDGGIAIPVGINLLAKLDIIDPVDAFVAAPKNNEQLVAGGYFQNSDLGVG